jgi:hypothetical protein
VLDVNLAGEYSFPVAAALDGRNMPYVFLTGYDVDGVFPSEYRSVARISKPFRFSDAAPMLAAHFGPRLGAQAKAGDADHYRFELTVDTRWRDIRRANKVCCAVIAARRCGRCSRVFTKSEGRSEEVRGFLYAHARASWTRSESLLANWRRPLDELQKFPLRHSSLQIGCRSLREFDDLCLAALRFESFEASPLRRRAIEDLTDSRASRRL